MTGPPAPRKLRLFIAVPAPDPVRREAGRVAARLKGAGDVRWVRPELLHVTLKFLGATPPAMAPEIGAAVEKIANNFSPFMVELAGAGAFPNLRRPQTLWMGLNGDLAPLGHLAKAVEGAADGLGFEREKRAFFRPHLTVGRVKSAKGVEELSRRLREVAAEPVAVNWPVEEIHLVKSVLRPSGPEYTTLARFLLGKRGER